MHQVPSKTGGKPETKEVLLEDDDPVWVELRHAHIADVCFMCPTEYFFLMNIWQLINKEFYIPLTGISG